jgi:hypothetical protein
VVGTPSPSSGPSEPTEPLPAEADAAAADGPDATDADWTGPTPSPDAGLLGVVVESPELGIAEAVSSLERQTTDSTTTDDSH